LTPHGITPSGLSDLASELRSRFIPRALRGFKLGGADRGPLFGKALLLFRNLLSEYEVVARKSHKEPDDGCAEYGDKRAFVMETVERSRD